MDKYVLSEELPSRRSIPNSSVGNRQQQQKTQGQAEQHSAAGGGPQQRHQGQAERGHSTGGSVASGGPQQRHQGQAEPGCSTGGSRSLMNERSQARAGTRQNVGFFKAGNLHRPGMASQERRHKVSLGSRRRALGARGGQARQGSVMETITLESDSS